MKNEYAGLFSHAGFAGGSFDIAAGPANTGIIDILLATGNGALTEDAPLCLVSTGALTAARTLDISGLEDESAARGGVELIGRFFMLSVQNSDIDATVKITLSGSATINGAATMDITSTGDYMFQYLGAGAWIANVLPRPAEKLATLSRLPFAGTVWNAGAAKHTIKVLQTGSPAVGQIGPHSLTPATSYQVQIYNTDITPYEKVDAEIFVDNAGSGDITLKKGAGAPNFNGIVIITGSLD